MISSLLPQLPDLMVVVAYGLVCWMVGVGWAAYRALSWVERINSWAASCECPEPEPASTDVVSQQSMEGLA